MKRHNTTWKIILLWFLRGFLFTLDCTGLHLKASLAHPQHTVIQMNLQHFESTFTDNVYIKEPL